VPLKPVDGAAGRNVQDSNFAVECSTECRKTVTGNADHAHRGINHRLDAVVCLGQRRLSQFFGNLFSESLQRLERACCT
jgi:hypothetical protein